MPGTLARAFALLAYALTGIAMLALMAFLLDLGPWKTLARGAPPVAWLSPLPGNVVLVMLFALHHSLAARPAVRQWLAAHLPAGMERSLYVAVASGLLLLLMTLWQPMPEMLWELQAPWARIVLWAVHGAGWALVVAATFQLDHWSLFGLRQAWRPQTLPRQAVLATPGLYGRVRHPLMSGFLLLLWTLPDFTQGHAVLATALTLYILIGIRFEERDLRRELGPAYEAYAAQVPALVPRKGRLLPDRTSVRSPSATTVHERLMPAMPLPHTPIVLVLPAMGVAASYYERFGQALADSICGPVWLLDLPGQGSDPLRASQGDDFGYDDVVVHGLPALVEGIVRQHPGRKVFLVGHSLGGQLALLALEHLGPHVAGLALVASGTAHARAWPPTLRLRAQALAWAVSLAGQLLPWFPGRALGFGGNQARRWMRDWSHNARRGGYRLHAASGTGFRRPMLGGVTTPILALTLHGDPVAPWDAEQALLSLVPRAPLRRRFIRGVLTDAPWKRHFSWTREPDESVRHLSNWIWAQSRLPRVHPPGRAD